MPSWGLLVRAPPFPWPCGGRLQFPECSASSFGCCCPFPGAGRGRSGQECQVRGSLCPSPGQGRGSDLTLGTEPRRERRRRRPFCPAHLTLLSVFSTRGRLGGSGPTAQGSGGGLGRRGCGEVAALGAAVAAPALGRRRREDGVGAGARGAGPRPEFAGMFGWGDRGGECRDPGGDVRPSQAAPRGRNRLLEIPERPGPDLGWRPRWPRRPRLVGNGLGRPQILPLSFLLYPRVARRAAGCTSHPHVPFRSSIIFAFPHTPSKPPAQGLCPLCQLLEEGRERRFLVFWVLCLPDSFASSSETCYLILFLGPR